MSISISGKNKQTLSIEVLNMYYDISPGIIDICTSYSYSKNISPLRGDS